MSETEAMPYDDRDDKSGRFRQEFTDSEFLEAVRNHDLPTTTDVSEQVGCKYRTAYERLNRLEDSGQLRSRKIGNSLVWSETEGDE